MKSPTRLWRGSPGCLPAAELSELVAVIGGYVLPTVTINLAQTRVDDFWTR